MRLLTFSALALALSATAAPAATFNIFEAGTTSLLGTFEAPLGGGPLTAASISAGGGVFDVLALGSMAPVYDAVNNWITGAASPFGAVSNSVAFMTTDISDNDITCGIGECFFSLTDSSGGGAPAEWYLDYVPGVGTPAAIDAGFYEIAPIPLPASALLLAGALAAVAGVAAGRRRAA
jgi:hypothetical protein